MNSEMPPPSPPSAPDWRTQIGALKSTLDDLGRRLEELASEINEHDDRLDVHDLKFESLEASMRDLRRLYHQMQSDILRIADSATTNAVTLERQAKQLYIQNKSLELIAGNTSEVLARLQPKVVL